ncbi:MAG TPA: amylo-alpha-1,6-glucosidase [Polyangia bacterium]|nr:amylo-alpha-1,6-glucosidase [Polyangia bacterium]
MTSGKSVYPWVVASDAREWLETDGLGGFAMGPVAGPRARRYHGLLVTAMTPPTGRVLLVSGVDVTVETPRGRWSLSAQRYAPDTTTGDGDAHLESFAHEPWPTWTFRLPDGTRLAHELFMRAGAPQVFLSWRLLAGPARSGDARAAARLTVRPFLAGRAFHALMVENAAFSFEPAIAEGQVYFHPYAGVPAIAAASNGAYRHQPFWYRRFLYEEERRRGLDCEEDLASPGAWTFELGASEAALLFGAELGARAVRVPAVEALETARAFERARRDGLGGPLDRAADQYFIARGAGRTIIAGYPWFGDWGRDTFIALRGLGVARGRILEAVDVLSTWAGLVSEGMLPNCFPDATGVPEYNTVDASLWYAVAASEAILDAGAALAAVERHRLADAIEAILVGYANGTRYGIRATDDGLLAAGAPGQQLTWMDARVDGHAITPRIGKPVEVQALWLNALAAAAALGAPSATRWRALFERGAASFEARFWDEARGRLNDVVDCDHVPGAVDARLRPNQIFAVGGLPLSLLSHARALRVVDAVEASLLTPLGLRTLGPEEPGYRARYEGGVVERDSAYHEGTVWPWLMGPFAEAHVRVHGNDAAAVELARARFLEPLARELETAGLGHLPEVADGEAPHHPGGCPFQAWSLGELLRLDRRVLAPQTQRSQSIVAPPAPGESRRGDPR